MNLEKEFKIIKEFEKKNQKIFNEGKPFNKYRSKKIVYKSKVHLKQLKERFINGRPENKLKKFAEYYLGFPGLKSYGRWKTILRHLNNIKLNSL